MTRDQPPLLIADPIIGTSLNYALVHVESLKSKGKHLINGVLALPA